MYVYGDYCTGEIFGWDGNSQTLLLDTNLNIASFGEDERGELYVVGLGGTVSRIMSTSPSCTYGITPGDQSVEAAGAAAFLDVTAGTGCGWTAASNAPWIRVASGHFGSGNGTVLYSVEANTSASPRMGTMTIAGRTFTVNQGPLDCGTSMASSGASISPSHATVGRRGGTGIIAIAVSSGCSWTAVSDSSWITITAGTAGAGRGTVSYSVAPLRDARDRKGRLTIAGLPFSITQTR
jgi:hypothetical protein